MTKHSLPVLDLDRQSFRARFGPVDCKVTIWWQPFDENWYFSFVAVATPIVTSKRITNNSKLLPISGETIEGNIFCRPVNDFEDRDPKRDAWGSGSHHLVWETETMRSGRVSSPHYTHPPNLIPLTER